MSDVRICPRCKTAELAPRLRICQDCYDGVPVQQTRALSRPPEVTLLTVVSSLRRTCERPVVLACGCTVSSTLWQEETIHCRRHGESWIARIGRGGGE